MSKGKGEKKERFTLSLVSSCYFLLHSARNPVVGIFQTNPRRARRLTRASRFLFRVS